MTNAPTASAAEPLPSAAAAPVSSQPKPVAAGQAPASAAQPAEPPLPAEEVATLLARADALFGIGDIVSARLYYERAAEGGDARAALKLGETYDPAFLAQAHLSGIRGDAAMAARWYVYSRGLGAAQADTLLTGLATSDGAAQTSEKLKQEVEQFLARQNGETR